MTEEQQEWARSIPGWIYFIYGLAVTPASREASASSCAKAAAVPLFAICLAAVLVQMTYTMLITRGLQIMGPTRLVMPSLVILFSAALLWFSRFARNRGWFGTASTSERGERHAIVIPTGRTAKF